MKRPVENGLVTDWYHMEKIWNHTFFEELHVDPEEHIVMLTESPFNSSANREKSTQIMFETFNVPALNLSSQSVLSLLSSGRSTGVVVECGYGDMRAAAIVDGKVIPGSVKRSEVCNGQEIGKYLNKITEERGYSFTTSQEIELLTNNYLPLHGYTALDFEAELALPEEQTEIDYELPDGQIFTLGRERFRCCETIFIPSLLTGGEVGNLGIHALAQGAILHSDEDIRKELYSNIVLAGGISMFRGLPERLEKEMALLAPPDTKVEISSPPDRTHAAWLGGALVASLSSFEQVLMTKEEYDEVGPTLVHSKCPL